MLTSAMESAPSLRRSDAWKEQVQSDLADLAKEYLSFRLKADELKNSVISHSLSYPSEAQLICSYMDNFIAERCEDENSIQRNNGHHRIAPEVLSDEIKAWKFRNGHSQPTSLRSLILMSGKALPDLSLEEMISYTVNTYDFEKLDIELSELPQILEQKSYAESAAELGQFFRILDRFTPMEEDELVIKRQRGLFLLKRPYRHLNRYRRVDLYKELLPFIRVFEAESEVNGLTECLEEVIRLENSLRCADDFVESRTTVKKGHDEIQLFRHHIYFKFSQSFFESLISYIRAYSKEKIRSIKLWLNSEESY